MIRSHFAGGVSEQGDMKKMHTKPAHDRIGVIPSSA